MLLLLRPSKTMGRALRWWLTMGRKVWWTKGRMRWNHPLLGPQFRSPAKEVVHLPLMIVFWLICLISWRKLQWLWKKSVGGQLITHVFTLRWWLWWRMGISEDMLTTAFNHLCENKKAARGFLAKNAKLRKL